MSFSLFILIWLILLALNMPVFLTLSVSSSLYLYLNDNILLSIPQKLTGAANSFPLLAAPFFILTGNLMNKSGTAEKIFKFAESIVGFIPGGLGHTNIIGSMIFSGMTGSAVADAGGLGSIEIKAMRDRNYDPEFSAGITAASSTIGPIIPPSIPMVLYGVLAGASIGGLFVAGIIPGILMGGALMIMVYYYSKKGKCSTLPRPSLREIIISFKEAFLSLLTPVLLIGGILSGIFTPTESAVISSLYALILGGIIYKKLKFNDIYAILLETVETLAIVMLIVMGAFLFGWILTISRIPQDAALYITSLNMNKNLFLLIINIFLLFVGCFMETLAALTILIPILLPIINGFDINPIHFGIIIILNLMIGTLTPPIGIVLYVVSRVSNIPIKNVIRGTAPFLIPLIAVLILVTYFPIIPMYLPRLLLGIK